MSGSMKQGYGLSQRKLEVLKKLRKKGVTEETIQTCLPPRIAHREDTSSYPLSFVQQRLWFLEQLTPGTGCHNVAVAWQLQGQLDKAALADSLRTIMQRHEGLRSTFANVEGVPVQSIRAEPGDSIQEIDLRTWPVEEREQELLQVLTREQNRPFDLKRDSLVRVLLLFLDDETFVLQLTIHVLVIDASSMAIVCNELALHYNAFKQRQVSALPALPLQYADFAAWQQNWVRGAVLEQQLAYWKEQLAGTALALNLPVDHPRPPIQPIQDTTCQFEFSAALTKSLEILSQQQGVTLFTLLLTAFQVLLYRYTHQENITIGSPLAQRSQSELSELIGNFSNTLLLKTSLTGNPTFQELLKRVHTTVTTALTYQDVPCEQVINRVQYSNAPLYQTTFALYPAAFPKEKLTGLTLSTLQPLLQKVERTKDDLSLYLEVGEEKLSGYISYSRALFEAATIEALKDHYQQLLAAIVADPGSRVENLPLLTPVESQQLLVEWNATTLAYPQDQCIQELFEAQVARTPERVAIIDVHQELTYRKLNEQANQLAHHLQKLGVGPEVVVGICASRSSASLVGLLGILKAGGAYLPLDPAYPRERLRFMLEDSRAAVLLTEPHLLERLPEHQATLIYLTGSESQQLTAEPITNVDSIVCSKNAAYVIYTSGSTGRPKGVIVEHHNTVAMLYWAAQFFTAEDFSGTLASTSICFDVSVFEIFAPLSWGGCLIIAENVLYLPGLVAAEKVTMVNSVPSALAEFLRSADLPSSVRTVNLGGEALSNKTAQLVYQHSACRRVHNLYGPTEDTTYSTVALVQQGTHTLPTIGRPIANGRAYVLDRSLQPVPIGVVGEIYLGGAGLTRGYLNRPELTAARFIPDPLSQEAGARLYRTGDLGRYLRDGQLEYLGRMDMQVKIHGFRIEPGEVEAVLNLHPAIQEGIVVAQQERSGDTRLVAYVTADTPVSTRQLRTFLQQYLPDNMLPTIFVQLEALPLNANGKVDRKALPAIERNKMATESGATMTHDAIEQALVELWQEVLDINRVGIHDNFFELGGHSLTAMRLTARLRTDLQVDITLNDFFKITTIAELAALIKCRGHVHLTQFIPPLKAVPHDRDLPLSFAQQRLWFLDQLESGTAAYNCAEAWHLQGPLKLWALEQSLCEIVRRHEALRTTFFSKDGSPYQRISSPPTMLTRLIDISEMPAGEQPEYAYQFLLREALRPFDLQQGPLLRVYVLQLNRDEHILQLVMHHIISDGWSMSILWHELVTFYNNFSQNQPVSLPDLAIQYADFATWQRHWLQGEVLEQQLAYWKKHLAGIAPGLALPTDRPRPPSQTFRGATERICLSATLTEALKLVSQHTEATLFMTLLAAFQLFLYLSSGQEDIAVGSPIANRTHSKTEALIGFFVNTLVLRTDLSGNPTFTELLLRVRTLALDAYDHQEVPFESIVEAVQHGRDASRNPLFQIFFVLQNAAMAPEELVGITARSVDIENTVTKFDLSLSLHEEGSELVGGMEYNSDLFDALTVQRMVENYRYLLTAIIANPEQQIQHFCLAPTSMPELPREGERNDDEQYSIKGDRYMEESVHNE